MIAERARVERLGNRHVLVRFYSRSGSVSVVKFRSLRLARRVAETLGDVTYVDAVTGRDVPPERVA